MADPTESIEERQARHEAGKASTWVYPAVDATHPRDYASAPANVDPAEVEAAPEAEAPAEVEAAAEIEAPAEDAPAPRKRASTKKKG